MFLIKIWKEWNYRLLENDLLSFSLFLTEASDFCIIVKSIEDFRTILIVVHNGISCILYTNNCRQPSWANVKMNIHGLTNLFSRSLILDALSVIVQSEYVDHNDCHVGPKSQNEDSKQQRDIISVSGSPFLGSWLTPDSHYHVPFPSLFVNHNLILQDIWSAYRC